MTQTTEKLIAEARRYPTWTQEGLLHDLASALDSEKARAGKAEAKLAKIEADFAHYREDCAELHEADCAKLKTAEDENAELKAGLEQMANQWNCSQDHAERLAAELKVVRRELLDKIEDERTKS